MKLKTLIKHLPIKRIQGDDVCEISGIHSDSRQISKGMLFVAVSGTTVDGRNSSGHATCRSLSFPIRRKPSACCWIHGMTIRRRS